MNSNNFSNDAKSWLDFTEYDLKTAISSRYPGQYGGPEGLYNESDARVALKSAEEILNFVKKQVS